MNVASRPPVVYPTFHDSQRQQQKSSSLSQKDMAIDDSIYHLLSMYLDTNMMPPATTTQNSRVMMLKHSPYFRSKRRMLPSQQQHQNWLGETKKSSMATCTELERNTIKNSYTTSSIDNDTHDESKIIKTKTRSKSVSFSETVTVINQDEKLIPAADDTEEDDEDLFVDALENFTE